MSATRTLPTGTILPVSGVSFRQDVVASRHVGEDVVLRHDVSNPYDKWAVAVETIDGKALGFVPAKGGLAQRLSECVPGGVWSATISEVLAGGDTVGLRIRLEGLREKRSAKPGSDRKGVRSLADGVSEDGQLTGEEVPSKGALRAYGPGGRLLGLVITQDAGVVRVDSGDGKVRAYPSALVRVLAGA